MIKVAIAGTGMIAVRAVKALKQIPGYSVCAIYAREHSLDKGRSLASEAGDAIVFTDYEQMLSDCGADFVYIGLVNSAHYGYSKKALEAGYNVICEKPFCVTSKQARELALIALCNGLYIFEAVTTLHFPNFKALKKLIPSLGNIDLVFGIYYQYSSRYDKYLKGEVLPVFDPKLAGGCLMDLNCYLVNLVVGLLGTPGSTDYTAEIGFNGIDLAGKVTLSYGKGQGEKRTYRFDPAIILKASKIESSRPSMVSIEGQKGRILIDDSPNFLRHFKLITADGEKEYALNQYEDKMIHEFIDFKEVYEHRDFGTMRQWLHHALVVSRILEIDRSRAGLGF